MAVNPSWLRSANEPDTDFPLANLPFGVFEQEGHSRIGIAIGDQILDLHACSHAGLLEGLPRPVAQACRPGSLLNELAALGNLPARSLRQRAAELLSNPNFRPQVEPLLVSQSSTRMLSPFRIGDYTDFYASVYHATNVGSLFRPDNPLLPNYKYVPIGYHGRSSSIVVSGTNVRRPCGQAKAPDASAPTFGPTRSLDYELEVGFYIARGNSLGEPIALGEAEDHIFGLCLLNDWSARDIQSWEYQPLGPFLAKSFASSISPWVVALDALAPYRVAAFTRAEGDPPPLPYLQSPQNQQRGGIDLHVEVWLRTAQMRASGSSPFRVSRGNLRDLYWTLAQMLTHHASNGCNLRPGDLLATGTISGPTLDSLGCLLEKTRRGADPLLLPNGEQRRFLEDGDEVILRAFCEGEGLPRIGFGECRGIVLPVLALP